MTRWDDNVSDRPKILERARPPRRRADAGIPPQRFAAWVLLGVATWAPLVLTIAYLKGWLWP